MKNFKPELIELIAIINHINITFKTTEDKVKYDKTKKSLYNYINIYNKISTTTPELLQKDIENSKESISYFLDKYYKLGLSKLY